MAMHRPRHSPWPAIPMDQALQILNDQVGAILGELRLVEEKQANEAANLLGMVLAESVVSLQPVPAFPASIKDGYAVRAADGPGRREVIGISTAGSCAQQIRVGPGQCARVSTGAKVPEGADAVVQVEDTKLLEHDDHEELAVEICCVPRPNQDIRQIGSDLAQGELMLNCGARLGPAEIGLLALSRSKKVRVFMPPRVCVLSTGDELVDSLNAEENDGSNSEARGDNAVIDTNRPMLLALFRSSGFVPIDCGIAADDEHALIGAIRRALAMADVLVVSGGVSMGEKDLLKDILSKHFNLKIHFGRVFLKPGLPTTFAAGVGPDGRPKFVFGLPGNPISTFVTAHLFVLPQLRRIAGLESPHWENARLNVQLAHPVDSLDARPEYRRAILRPSPHSSTLPMAECVSGHQISSRLLSARSANLLLELPPRNDQSRGLKQGDTVSALVIGPF